MTPNTNYTNTLENKVRLNLSSKEEKRQKKIEKNMRKIWYTRKEGRMTVLCAKLRPNLKEICRCLSSQSFFALDKQRPKKKKKEKKKETPSRLFTFASLGFGARQYTFYRYVYLFQLEQRTKWMKKKRKTENNTLSASLRVYRLLWEPSIIQK